jgi:hypothetical protein
MSGPANTLGLQVRGGDDARIERFLRGVGASRRLSLTFYLDPLRVGPFGHRAAERFTLMGRARGDLKTATGVRRVVRRWRSRPSFTIRGARCAAS